MPRYSLGVNKIRNEYIRETAVVEPFGDKIRDKAEKNAKINTNKKTKHISNTFTLEINRNQTDKKK